MGEHRASTENLCVARVVYMSCYLCSNCFAAAPPSALICADSSSIGHHLRLMSMSLVITTSVSLFKFEEEPRFALWTCNREFP